MWLSIHTKISPWCSPLGPSLGFANKINKRGTGRRRKPWLQGWGVAQEEAPQQTPALPITCQDTGWCKALEHKRGELPEDLWCMQAVPSLSPLPDFGLVSNTLLPRSGVLSCRASWLSQRKQSWEPDFLLAGNLLQHVLKESTKGVHPSTTDKISFN